MNIFNIQSDLLEIYEELEDNGGELTPELEAKLEVTQSNFKNKIKGYAEVIKSINADINLCDEEIKRLNALKKSKQGIIDRLTDVCIRAIDMFGDTTKSGGKFVDYGTGKVSVRNSVKCEVNTDKIDCIANEFTKAVAFEVMLGGASNREGVSVDELIQRCSEHVDTKEDCIVNNPFDVTQGDILNTNVEITISKPLSNLLFNDGYELIKRMIKFDSAVKVSAKTDKANIKKILSEGDSDITIAELEPNKTISIK